jgi:hypothetical protein
LERTPGTSLGLCVSDVSSVFFWAIFHQISSSKFLISTYLKGLNLKQNPNSPDFEGKKMKIARFL